MTSATRLMAEQYSHIDPFQCWNVAELHIYLSRAQAKVEVLEDANASLRAQLESQPGGPDYQKAAESRKRYAETKELFTVTNIEGAELSGLIKPERIRLTIQPCHGCGRVSERMVLAGGVWRCEGGCQP